MANEEAYQSISDAITGLFQTIEKITSPNGTQNAPHIRTKCIHDHIGSLKELVKSKQGDLELIEFELIMSILERVEKAVVEAKKEMGSLEDKYYDDLLKEFKGIWGIKIPIEKLDLKE